MLQMGKMYLLKSPARERQFDKRDEETNLERNKLIYGDLNSGDLSGFYFNASELFDNSSSIRSLAPDRTVPLTVHGHADGLSHRPRNAVGASCVIPPEGCCRTSRQLNIS